MRYYDQSLPLIAIHIPKTGGTSVRKIFEGWFLEGLLAHYKRGENLPLKHNLSYMHSRELPIVVYGHFNTLRNFGIEQYYPEAKQFISIVRDPFARAVSRYFFQKSKSLAPKKELRDTLLNQGPELSMLCHFPRKVTMDNYKEIIETQFIEIGVMEYLDESLKIISKKLNKQYNSKSLHRLNVSKKDSRVPYDLREEFIEKNPLEYAVYNYVLNKYT